MKGTDLMIGDWVRYTTPPYIKVANLTKHKVGYHTKPAETRMHYARLGEVSPIPLTAEILLANGFERSGSNYVVADDYYDIVVHVLSDSVWEVQYTDCEMSLGSQQTHVCHVHTLQHALRLFGIEKDLLLI